MRKYSLNESFFEKLNANSAYVLGYIWTDGCLFRFCKNRPRPAWGLLLECQIRDREILEYVKTALGTNAPIKVRKRLSPATGKEIEMAKLSIYSKKIAEDLMRYGVVPGKSKLDPVPIGVPDDVVWHFIRGALDGDGCVHKMSSTERIELGFTGKKKFLEWINDRFVRLLGVKSRKLYASCPTRLTRSECWQLRYFRQRDVGVIQSALYAGDGMSLKRKRLLKAA